MVEKRATFGGTCLNVGCIPSKAMLHASELYEEAGTHFGAMGIDVKPKLDLAKMLAFKDEGVKGNTDGVAFLMRKNKVDHFHGTGRIKAPGVVEVTFINGEKQDIDAKSIVIATGSDVAKLPGIDIDEKSVVSSTGALSLPKVPKRLLVIGAGVIGLELGSVWRRLGAEVTVVEYLDRILPGTDGEVARQLQRMLEKQGMAFKLGHKVTGVEKKGGAQSVTIEPSKGGDGGDAGDRRRAGRHRPRAVHRRARARRRRASSSTTAGASSSMRTTSRTCRASTPSATSSTGRCWRTRPRTRASPSPRSSPGRPGT